MSKRDELKFTVKKTLVVGTATASLAASGCVEKNTTLTNPVPSRDAGVETDTADAEPADDTDRTADSSPADDTDPTSDAESDTTGNTADAASDTGSVDGS